MIHHELNLIQIITGISLPDDRKIYIQALILTSILNIPEICRTFRKVEFNHFNMCAKGENILERIVALQKECTRTYWRLSVLTTKNCCKWGQFCVTQPSVYFFLLSSFLFVNFHPDERTVLPNHLPVERDMTSDLCNTKREFF